MPDDVLERALAGHNSAVDHVRRQWPQLELAAAMIRASREHGGKLLLLGNGGSAADAQHIAAEFIGRFQRERDALPAIALTTDTSILTSVGNDYGFEHVFARQVDGLARPGDVVFGLSTSGSSRNVVAAIEAAKARGCRTIALTGEPGALAALVDLHIGVPGLPTARVQEAHIFAGHLLCELLDE
jgi:D-sedoheptulose 7-phosphate isomerase